MPPSIVFEPFPTWKSKLAKDAARCGLKSHLEAISDDVLLIFHQRGIYPTVNALLADCESESPDFAYRVA